jgi:hypothetical protein
MRSLPPVGVPILNVPSLQSVDASVRSAVWVTCATSVHALPESGQAPDVSIQPIRKVHSGLIRLGNRLTNTGIARAVHPVDPGRFQIKQPAQ